MEKKELIRKWMEGELSPSEHAVLETLPEYRDYRKITEYSARFQKPDFNEQQNLQLLRERMKAKPPEKGRLIRLSNILKIAAILLLLISSALFIHMNNAESVVAGTGEITSHNLPDNSRVRLNAASEIEYYPNKWKSTRAVNLRGEAFFEVQKGSEFMVETNQGTIIVLGTSFNVKTREGFFEVICYEGSVKVTHSGTETVLKQNEFYKVIEEHVETGLILADEKPDWIQQESTFRAVPLKFVLGEIERQFGLEIEANGVDGEQLISGSFSHSDKRTALESVTIPLGLKYRIESGNKVKLYEE